MSNSAVGNRIAEAQQEESCRKRKDGTATATSVTVELEVLDCPVCFEPLRPPIFQCAVGHLICSSCCGKLPNPKKYMPPLLSPNFSGSTGMLQEHFTDEHKWPSTKFRYGWCFYTNIKEGIHVISGEDGQLFLLNVASEPFGCVISVFCVQPHDTDPKFRCALSLSYWKNGSYHAQSSEFQVPSMTLSDGLPRDCFLFIVPKFYLDEDSKICVTMKKASA
ncbi:unnamed protein product [Urochloa decumbens]|uniref:E3 ubiquitin-protein ligase Sina-like RING finger domain-containing protein n=1 Tax=Urochloa decumbens TaxID=240449 RepID=A0ABC9HCQ1_9POAL